MTDGQLIEYMKRNPWAMERSRALMLEAKAESGPEYEKAQGVLDKLKVEVESREGKFNERSGYKRRLNH